MALVDEKGLPLIFGDILAGNHHDLFETALHVKMCKALKTNEIEVVQLDWYPVN